jgi:hypothetical protein
MDEVGRCRDCRWWAEGSNHPTEPTWGTCALITTATDPGVRATSFADLVTAPDFGCIRFEVADEEDD